MTERDIKQVTGETPSTQTIAINEGILSKNDLFAARNRSLFTSKRLLVLNVLSSPGSGKTALIERTLTDLRGRLRGGVVVGDLATDNDAKRIARSGAPAIQITTGDMCHLEADMVGKAAGQINLDNLDVLIIENVGNLVCPSGYDLGENLRVVILAATEGEDKPLKYPVMFKTADVVLVNKMDIAEAAGFDRVTALDNIQRIAPQATVFEVSARTGLGMEQWYAYLEQQVQRQRLATTHSV
ncbi:MAG: hydrogenase nickel incorporation protein HypB [Anaerolineae bacterium]